MLNLLSNIFTKQKTQSNIFTNREKIKPFTFTNLPELSNDYSHFVFCYDDGIADRLLRAVLKDKVKKGVPIKAICPELTVYFDLNKQAVILGTGDDLCSFSELDAQYPNQVNIISMTTPELTDANLAKLVEDTDYDTCLFINDDLYNLFQKNPLFKAAIYSRIQKSTQNIFCSLNRRTTTDSKELEAFMTELQVSCNQKIAFYQYTSFLLGKGAFGTAEYSATIEGVAFNLSNETVTKSEGSAYQTSSNTELGHPVRLLNFFVLKENTQHLVLFPKESRHDETWLFKNTVEPSSKEAKVSINSETDSIWYKILRLPL